MTNPLNSGGSKLPQDSAGSLAPSSPAQTPSPGGAGERADLSPNATLTVLSARHIAKQPLKWGDRTCLAAVALICTLDAAQARGPIKCSACGGEGIKHCTCGECGSDYDRKCRECDGTGDALKGKWLTLADIQELEKKRGAK